jgi:hypothetical protein
MRGAVSLPEQRTAARGTLYLALIFGSGLSRRFSKDYERLPETAVAMIYSAMSRIKLRRLVRAV